MTPEVSISPLFDTNEVFRVEIKSGGIRAARLRYPTDAKWIERANHQRIIQQNLGRGKFTTRTTSIEAWDEALFKTLLIEAPDKEFDEYEASAAIDALGRADVVGQELINEEQISLKVMVFAGIETTHILRLPRRRACVEFSRESVLVTHDQKGSSTKVSLEPSLRLYDPHLVSHSGYAPNSAVPIMHKDQVIVEIMRAVNPEA